MAEELYLNNFKIELPDRVVAQTLQINDVAEVVDRQANYSNNIKIPRTSNNIQALEMLGISGNTTRYPYASISVKYIVDGIELISEGKGIIKNTNEFYNLIIYDGNISMPDLLGTDELQALDFSAYDHTLTQSLFFNSVISNDGYIYAIGNFFNNEVNDRLNIAFTSPSFYVHTLFKMIFEQKGYAISGNILSTTDFRSRVFSMSRGYDRVISDNMAQVYTQYNNVAVDETFGTPTTKDYVIDTYNAVSTLAHNFTTVGTVQVFEALTTPVVLTNLFVKLNGVPVHTEPLVAFGDPVVGIHPVNFDFDIAVDAGDVVTVGLTFVSDVVATLNKIKFTPDYTTTISSNDLSLPVAFADIIGEATQISFVKDVMQRFGMIYRKLRNVNEFEFTTMETLLSDQVNAEDWSNKYSSFGNEEYKPNYAQVNYMKHKYDDSDGVLTFGDGDLLVDNVNLAEEKTLLTSIFKASSIVNDLYLLKHWVANDDEGVITYLSNEDDIRIFKLDETTDTISYRFSEDVETYSVRTGDVAYLDFEPVNYQNEIDAHYVEFGDMLDDYKKINLMVNLNLIDVYSVDFFKLKYFDQLGKYYYLNKVSNFKKNKLTMCEFVQVGTL